MTRAYRGSDSQADIIVRGGGIFGLSCAWEAARRGARVILLEREAIGAGSSGGVVGALSPHVPENWNEKKAFQLESLLAAERFWAEVEAVSGRESGYGRTGRLQSLADQAAVDLAQARSQTAKALWHDHAVWELRACAGGWEPQSPTGLLIYDSLSGRLHPRMAAQALVAALEQKGCEIVIGPDAERFDTGRKPVIWATGYAGLMELNRSLSRTENRPVGGGVKGQALVLAYDAGFAPQLFVDGLHIIPHADGTVAIGSTSEQSWDDPKATDARVEVLHERAIAACPALTGAEVVERWAGVRPRARSRAPMLGPIPGQPGAFVVNGGFKIGFGMAPKVAQVMMDLVLEGRDEIPPGFRVEASL